MSNSFDSDQMPSYSASHPCRMCLHMTGNLRLCSERVKCLESNVLQKVVTKYRTWQSTCACMQYVDIVLSVTSFCVYNSIPFLYLHPAVLLAYYVCTSPFSFIPASNYMLVLQFHCTCYFCPKGIAHTKGLANIPFHY